MIPTPVPRPPARRRWLLRITAVGAAAVLLGSAMTTVAVVSSAAATPLTVNASADAYVAADAPDTNFGTATNLTVRAASATKPEAFAYVRFSVTGLTRPPSGVSLQLFSYAQSATGAQVFTSGSDWTESAVTWNTGPARGTTMVANMPSLVTNQYASADVSSAVTGNGTYTFAITTTSTLSKQFASREVTANPPRLLISTTTPDTVTATAGSGQSAAVSSAYAAPLAATVTDGSGNPVANLPVTFTAPASGASATFAGGAAAVSVSTDATGVATTPALTANATAGSFQVSATTANAAAPATYTLTNGTTTPPTTTPPTTTPPTTTPPTGTSTTYTFKATADSYVRSDQPDSTHGSEFVVNTQAGTPTMTSYLHFNVAGVAGTVTATNLQLYSYSTSAQGVVVAGTTSGWTEAGLTYNNAPAVGAVVGNGPNIVVNTLASVDITGAVTGNAGYDFALSTARTTINKFASRESSTNQPTLVVTAVTGSTTPPTTPPPTTTPPTTTPPTTTSPTPGSPTPTIPAGSGVTAVGGAGQHAMTGAVFAAPLAAKVVDAAGSPVVGTAVTFTAPASGATATFPGDAATITVSTDGDGVATTPPLTAGSTAGTYAVTATAGAQSANFALTNTDPTIVAGGDIACTAGKAVTATSCQQLATSDLALSLHPDALLPLGDDQYELGSLSDFQNVYGPTWGRMNAIAHPVPGNHEYGYIGTDIQPTGGTGYFTYFGNPAHPLDPGCTTLCKSWYSWNIGSWHMIALDSQCGVVGGCNPGNVQYQWLLNDLNANSASRCVLAYWHIPLFSSSQDHQPDMQAIYNLLTTKGADVVLNGHAHFYERFNPQDGTATANPNSPAEFIVGSGGRNFFSIRTTRSANSAVGIANTFGVLQMTLSNGSYNWNFVTSNSGGTPDSGSASCH
jgi:hypothetical protein